MHPIFLASASSHAMTTEWPGPGTVIFQLAVVAFLVFLNGFFVASEFAIVKARGSQLDALANRGDKRAELARHVTTHMDAYLSATQLGITLASLALGWVGEPFLAAMLHPFFLRAGVQSEAVIASASLAIAFSIVTFLHIVMGELAPKSLAIRRPVPTTLWAARPLQIFYVIFKLPIFLLNGAANFLLKHLFRLEPASEHEIIHSEEELGLILSESMKGNALSARGTDISRRAMALRRRTVRDVVTPRRQVIFLDVEASFAENLKVAKSSGHTRFPLCSEHLDNSIGLIHIKDMIAFEGEREPELSKLQRPLLTVPEMMSLEALLELFLARHAHLAVALDEFGGAVGIVTLDNVIEQLVGKIQDEFDAEVGGLKRLGEREYLLDGTQSLHAVREFTGLDLQSTEVSTLGGFLMEVLGHFPQRGEEVDHELFHAKILRIEGRLVRQVRLQAKEEE
jgi:CBS domain containing-hemolysin-like protein